MRLILIAACLESRLQWKEALNIASRPNTNCVGVARAVVCTVEFIAFRHAATTPLKPRKESRSLLSLICALWIMLWSVLWYLSIMEFACGLRLVIIFRLIPYSFLRVSLTSLANSFPLSIVIYIGHGYGVSQWSSNQLAIISAVFWPISTTSKNPVAGSIIVIQWSSMYVLVHYTKSYRLFELFVNENYKL